MAGLYQSSHMLYSLTKLQSRWALIPLAYLQVCFTWLKHRASRTYRAKPATFLRVVRRVHEYVLHTAIMKHDIPCMMEGQVS